MANIAKEATTVRRVLDPLFRLFDSHDYWSPENGIALSVLQEMQKLMDKSGAAISIHVISVYPPPPPHLIMLFNHYRSTADKLNTLLTYCSPSYCQGNMAICCYLSL